MKINIGPYVDDGDRVEEIEIHDYDTWSMDHTLALMIEPMLKQLKDTKHGAPNVDLEDVPKYLYPPEDWVKKDGDVDPLYFIRWDWVLDEMIWAFEQKNLDDWQEQYWVEHPEFDFDGPADADGNIEVIKIKDGVCDWEAMDKHQKRISNGFRLFGKYFENLWD